MYSFLSWVSDPFELPNTKKVSEKGDHLPSHYMCYAIHGSLYPASRGTFLFLHLLPPWEVALTLRLVGLTPGPSMHSIGSGYFRVSRILYHIEFSKS